MSEEYQPIDCSLHDRIEEHATLHEDVRIAYRTDTDVVEVTDRITDWFAKDGEEFMRTANGLTVRLDRIVSIDGVVFQA